MLSCGGASTPFPSRKPECLAAVFFAPLAVILSFDQPLREQEEDDQGPWSFRYGGKNYAVTHRSVSGSQAVLLVLALEGPALPGNVVTYTPPPHDVQTPEGVAALPFEVEVGEP